MSRPSFLGLGTGRCGTQSLVRIVGACENTMITHEHYAVPWYGTGSEQLGRLIREMKESSRAGVLRGEVANYMLPHVGEVRSAVSDLKVVVLHRDKAETVRSYMGHGSYMIRPHDKRGWVDNNVGRLAEAIKLFPLIDAKDPRQAFEFFWEMYESVVKDIAGPILHLDVGDLNDDEKVHELFDFLEIPKRDRVLIDKRKWHSTEERIMELTKRRDPRVAIHG